MFEDSRTVLRVESYSIGKIKAEGERP